RVSAARELQRKYAKCLLLLVHRPAFNLLKGTCKSFAKLEFHFEECYKAVNDRLDWHNPEGREYPFDLSKPLPLIEVQGRQVVPADYFINNDLKYLKGGSSSSKYATSTTRTKAAKDDNVLYKFKEGDFPRLNLCDIEDMILLLVQKKLSNLDVDDRYDLGVALRMFTRRIVILYHVEDLHLGVESYQKKLNITITETTRSNISKLTPYTAYKNLKESFIKTNMDYLPKRHWSNLEMKRSRIMVKAINKLLFERRLVRNLVKFVGGRNYENDLRLLERTI
nr:hypothetical protein [Tanacetum cinerariifolium]